MNDRDICILDTINLSFTKYLENVLLCITKKLNCNFIDYIRGHLYLGIDILRALVAFFLINMNVFITK